MTDHPDSLRLEIAAAAARLIADSGLDYGAAKLKASTGAPVYMNESDSELYGHIDVQAGWLGMETPERTEIDVAMRDGETCPLTSICSRASRPVGWDTQPMFSAPWYIRDTRIADCDSYIPLSPTLKERST